MKQWEIAPGSRICSQCERRFEADEVYWSEIVEGEAGYARRDYCERCRESASEAGRRVSAWRTVNRVAPRMPKVTVDPVNAFELLESYSATDPEDPRQKLAYLLALLLMRRKVIRFAGSEDGYLCFTRGGRQKVWRVREFEFEPAEMDEIQAELGALLELDEASQAEVHSTQTEDVAVDGGAAPHAENT